MFSKGNIAFIFRNLSKNLIFVQIINGSQYNIRQRYVSPLNKSESCSLYIISLIYSWKEQNIDINTEKTNFVIKCA